MITPQHQMRFDILFRSHQVLVKDKAILHNLLFLIITSSLLCSFQYSVLHLLAIHNMHCKTYYTYIFNLAYQPLAGCEY